MCHYYGSGESWSEPDGDLCNNSEGSFRSNEQLSNVKTSGRLVGSTSCFYHLSRRKDNRLIEFKWKIQTELDAPLTAFRNRSALAVPYRTAFAFQVELGYTVDKCDDNSLPEQPVASIPPTVAPGAGSS